MNHGGWENGRLHATYDQLVVWGIHRQRVRGAIDEAIALGLVEEVRKGGARGFAYVASQYRLTFRPVLSEASPATNEWRSLNDEDIEAWRAKQKVLGRARQRLKKKASTENRTELSTERGAEKHSISVKVAE